MITFHAVNRRRTAIETAQLFKGGSELIKFDWSSWAVENGAVTAVTWSVEAGDAALSGQSLASNVAQAQVTTANPGRSLIKLIATSGSDLDVRYVFVNAREPECCCV